MQQETTAQVEDDPAPPLEQVSLFARLLHFDAIGAIILLAAAAAALIFANSPLHEIYDATWEIELGIELHELFEWGRLGVTHNLHEWINDGLMCIFFFVVGLEIKRELIAGQLASVRKAMLPVAAAVGGMICPALIYAAFNWNTDAVGGWGIPMATDIAFAAGCLGLLGKRIPPALGVFLVALAIVDDIGSVTVIAVFYTERIAVPPLVIGMSLITISYCIGKLGVRSSFPFAIIGILLWLAFIKSGVHSTIAGILLAFTIPATARYETPMFYGRMTTLLNRFRHAEDFANPLLVNSRQQALIRSIETECHHVEAPLQRIEFNLHPYTVFLIMPLFAFANCGLPINFSDIPSLLTQPVALGIIFGLIAGKQIGIMFFSWLAVRLGLASLPDGIGWKHIYGVTWLAGIGFTMALFINGLAFGDLPDAADVYIPQAKMAIFISSLLAGGIGYYYLRHITPPSAKSTS